MNKNTLIFALTALAVVVLMVLDLASGSVWMSPTHWFGHMSEIEARILWYVRLPKMLTALMAGVALSVSGVQMQTLFRNPLAGPYILGVSSGASLGVATVTMCASLIGGMLSSLSTIMAAIVGATAVLMLVLLFSRRISGTVSLLIVGMMVGAIAGALVNVMQNVANPDALKLFIVWSLGSLQSVGWQEMPWLAGVWFIGMVLAVCLIKPLNGLTLGEDYARGLGINTLRVRRMLVLSTGLLAGGVTAFCGPIAFVGVAVPHIARGILSTSNHRQVVPMAALSGAGLLLICDIIASLGQYPLPISTVSALFGAPIILWIIIKG